MCICKGIKCVAKKTEPISFKFCRECGAEINAKAEICPKCGVRIAATSENSIAGYIRRFSTEDFIAECIERFWEVLSFLEETSIKVNKNVKNNIRVSRTCCDARNRIRGS